MNRRIGGSHAVKHHCCAQWGDEGKGRYTDLLAAEAPMSSPASSGGDNAGHTVTVKDEIFQLHLIPSGIIHDRPFALIGNGVVLNPAVLLREMDALWARGVDVSPAHLKMPASNAHLITPAHIALDKASGVAARPGAIAQPNAASGHLTPTK
ncbi:MAG: adenylosuccinate synthetase [Chloroflexi bacterium]|nr:adenylosuccinate synthetase [Chloroflexota bacterium]